MSALRFRPRMPSGLNLPSLSIRPRRHPFHLRQSTSPHIRAFTSTIPYVPTCPPDTCLCAPVPIPELDIDRKTPLLHTMAHYAQHVVICSGKADWSSRIEDEEGTSGDFVRGLKEVIGRGGKRFDPFINILTSMSSLNSDPNTSHTQEPTTCILLFPSFQCLSIPHSSQNFSALSSAYLSAEKLHPAHEAARLTEEQKYHLVRDTSSKSHLPAPRPITKPVILICGHGGRDERCGILGPILVQRFWSVLKGKGIDAEVGTISHVGGHKFAGNVIIYMPPEPEPTHAENNGLEHRERTLDLKGSGLWYGRVGPENVAGIVEETIINGRIIADLFRGGISQKGDNLGRVLEEQLKRDGAVEEGALKLKPKPRAKKSSSSG